MRLAFAANRDELHARPTLPASWWDDTPQVLGGRDLSAGGSWLAIDRRGRLAAVTNLPLPQPRRFPRSRGELVSGFLTGTESAAAFAAAFAATSNEFAPCNLLVWDGAEFHYAATGTASQALQPGVHALGNALLGAEGPRMQRAERGFRDALTSDDPEAGLLELLADRGSGPADATASDAKARHTEIFIEDPRYGTRSSTVVLISNEGSVVFVERSHGPDGRSTGLERHVFAIEKAQAGS